MPKVRITKIGKVEDAKYEYLQNGEYREGEEILSPKIGKEYMVQGDRFTKFFVTTPVQSIIEGNANSTYMDIYTYNSIYRIEYLKE